MGIVVQLKAAGERITRRPPLVRAAGEACEIIILPCVRYERWTESASKPTPQKKKKSKRRSRARQVG